jgi:hypothetical protein
MAVIVSTAAMKPAALHPFFTKPLNSAKNTDTEDSDDATQPKKEDKSGVTQKSDPVSSKKRKTDAVRHLPVVEADSDHDHKEQIKPEPATLSIHHKTKDLEPTSDVQAAVQSEEAEGTPQQLEVKKGMFSGTLLYYLTDNKSPAPTYA